MGKTLRKHQPSTARSRTTRSHKPRLLADPSQSTANLDLQLRALGLYPADTLGDGNCLFRALSDQLYGSPSKHAFLRKAICDFIVANKARYEPFCEDERGLDVHIRCMRELGTYGGHLELSAFAHMVKRNVKVVQPGLVYVIEWSAGLTEEEAERELRKRREEEEREGLEMCTGTIYVAYHDWEHFSSIRNLAGPHSGLPNVVEAPAAVEDEEDEGDDDHARRERERAFKRERKEKEKRKITRVKLKLSAPPSTASTPPPPSQVSEASTVPTPDSRLSPAALGPMPSIDSMSSMTSLDTSASSPPDSSLATPPSSAPLGLSPAPTLTTNATVTPITALPLPMRVHRSPKRSFDESASSEDGQSVMSEDVERGRGKDKRSRIGSISQAADSQEVDATASSTDIAVVVAGESREETPALSADGSESDDEGGDGDTTDAEEREVAAAVEPVASPHVTPQEIIDEGYSSLSELSDSPEPEPVQPQPSKLKKVQKQVHVGEDGKPLTRRQRKALGLPKVRGVGTGQPLQQRKSAGKIVIPGGKFRGKSVVSGTATPEKSQEWVKTGVGRVDVRGFRELKI